MATRPRSRRRAHLPTTQTSSAPSNIHLSPIAPLSIIDPLSPIVTLSPIATSSMNNNYNHSTPLATRLKRKRENSSDRLQEEDPVAVVQRFTSDEEYARRLQEEFDSERPQNPSSAANFQISSGRSVDVATNDPLIMIASNASLSSFHRTLSGVSRSNTGRARRRGNPRVRHQPSESASSETSTFSESSFSSFDRSTDSFLAILNAAFDSISDAVPQRALSRDQLQMLPTRVFQSSESSSAMQCSICTCDYTEGEVLRNLCCFHEFHMGCIDEWLKINATCPVCRVDVNIR